MNKDGNYVLILSMLFVELGVFLKFHAVNVSGLILMPGVSLLFTKEIHTTLIGPTKAHNLFIYIHTKSK